MSRSKKESYKTLAEQTEEIVYYEDKRFASRLLDSGFREVLESLGLLSDALELEEIRRNGDKLTHILLQLRKLAELAARVETSASQRIMLDQTARELAAQYNEIAGVTNFKKTRQLQEKLARLGL